MHKYVPYVCVVLLLGVLTGCADTYQNYGRHSMWTPKPLFLTMPEGDDSYSIGFRDGCNTMIGAIGSAMLRNHNVAYDPNRGLQDNEYYRGYAIGRSHCTYFIDNSPL